MTGCARPQWVKWYKTANWQRLRFRQLSREPLCRFCGKKNIIEPATVVDHITPHRGKMDLFFSDSNLQSLCKRCHDKTKQRLEKSGEFGCDANGFPKDWQ